MSLGKGVFGYEGGSNNKCQGIKTGEYHAGLYSLGMKQEDGKTL